MRTRTTATVATVGAVALALTGCSTISTEADQAALHYSGGSLSSKKFQDCIPSGSRTTNGPGDGYFVYPGSGSQRDFTADSGVADREADSVTVVSKDNQQVAIPVTVTFRLNVDCTPITVGGKVFKGGIFQDFHERHGNKRHAYWNYDEEGEARADGAPKGWVSLLQFAIGTPLDRVADPLARAYDWKSLSQDPAVRAQLEASLTAALQAKVDEQMGAPKTDDGKQLSFFEDVKVMVGTPQPTNAKLVEAVAAEQAAVAQANAAEMKANADRQAAQAEVAVAQARAAAQKAELDALGPDVYIKKYAIDKGMTPYPNPVVAGAAPATK